MGLRLDGRHAADAQMAQRAIAHAVAEGAQVMVVAAYGLILPAWVLQTPPRGCLNIHASLLPRWRGAAPIHRAIEAGDTQTGITLMQMDEGLDTGDMLMTQVLSIAPDSTTGHLHDQLAEIGAQLCHQTLLQLAQNALRPIPQDAGGATYAAKISKAECQVRWQDDAALIERRIRAFNPAPGAVCALNGDAYKIWSAQVEPYPSLGPDQHGHNACGTVQKINDEGIWVATGQGVLRITELQKAASKRMSLPDFLRGTTLCVGDRFAQAASSESRI
jgi:methionyl-tRNA formyltransferase